MGTKCVSYAGRSEGLNFSCILLQHPHQPIRPTWRWTQNISPKLSGRLRGTGRSSPPRTLVFPCQYHSTDTPSWLIYQRHYIILPTDSVVKKCTNITIKILIGNKMLVWIQKRYLLSEDVSHFSTRYYSNWYSNIALWTRKFQSFIGSTSGACTGYGKITSVNFKVNNKKTIRDTKVLFLGSKTTTWKF